MKQYVKTFDLFSFLKPTPFRKKTGGKLHRLSFYNWRQFHVQQRRHNKYSEGVEDHRC